MNKHGHISSSWFEVNQMSTNVHFKSLVLSFGIVWTPWYFTELTWIWSVSLCSCILYLYVYVKHESHWWLLLSDPAEEVRSLLKALVLFQFDGAASSLQRDYGELLQLMETALPEIWTDNTQQGQTPVSHTQAPIDCFSAFRVVVF